MEALPRSRLVASAAVGAVVFGTAVAVVGWRTAADPRVTAAGLLTAGALTVALLLMIWARRRTGAGQMIPRGRHPGGEAAGDDGRLAVIPLGDGQAAVIWDEPAAEHPSRPASAAAADRETAVATAAIWAAVEAAVRAADPEPGPDGPERPHRPRRPWGRRRPDDAPPDSH